MSRSVWSASGLPALSHATPSRNHSPPSMKAWLLDDFTGLDRLRLAEAPEPLPQPGEAILALRYAALNPADRYLAEGQYPAKPPLPHILGRDGIGTVTQIGPGVSDLKVGDQLAILRGAVG